MDEFIESLCRRYGVGRCYAQAYLDYWNRTGKVRLESESDLQALGEPESMWFDFALSANWRGRQLVEALGPDPVRDGARYLDIGCGFGGMLVAFAEKGYEVQGIELDPIRVELAKSNLKDFAGTGTVDDGNILDKVYVRAQRPFDVITCIDVIEHVADVDAAIGNAISLLSEGGTLHLEIPNKDATDFVISDGHFSLFGITLLPRWAAIDYQQTHFNFEYDVGDYYPLQYYVRSLKRHGVVVTSRPSPLQPQVSWEEAEQKARGIIARLNWGRSSDFERAPVQVRPYLKAAAESYRHVIKQAWKDARKDAGLRNNFISRFGTRFWLVTAVKSAV